MKSQTALVARNCRLNEWARMVHDCKNRSAGMSVDEWCNQCCLRFHRLPPSVSKV